MWNIIIYTKDHKKLDEVKEISIKNYMHTLNGIGKMIFTIPLTANKFTPANFTELNHVELYENGNLRWYGVISNINFNNPEVEIACLGYLHLTEKLRLRKKIYYGKQYGDLIEELLLNTENKTNITMGIKQQKEVVTDRIIENTDFFYDKVTELIGELNYYIDVDHERKLNFRTEKGADKSHLKLQQSNEFSNIVKTPSMSKSTEELANCIYSETTYTEEETQNEITLTYEARNEESIKKYGLLSAVLDVNDIRIHDTLKQQVDAELKKREYPLVSITLEVVDSAICPMNQVEVGDYIMVQLQDYFNFTQKVRVIEIDRDCTTNIYKVTVGNVLYRENKINTKIYIG